MGRTAVNVAGNVTATLVIGKSENEFNQFQHDKYVETFKKSDVIETDNIDAL